MGFRQEQGWNMQKDQILGGVLYVRSKVANFFSMNSMSFVLASNFTDWICTFIAFKF